MNILEIKDVTYNYSNSREKVLSSVNQKFELGQFYAIIGKSGAGKSTLLSLLAGLDKPQKGKILFKNEDIAGQSIKERADKIGIVMQNPNQMISKAMIFDEVALGLKVRGIPEDEIKERVYNTIIPRLVRLAEAPSHGKPILEYEPRNKGTIAYLNLAKEVIERNGTEEESPR